MAFPGKTDTDFAIILNMMHRYEGCVHLPYHYFNVGLLAAPSRGTPGIIGGGLSDVVMHGFSCVRSRFDIALVSRNLVYIPYSLNHTK